MNKTAEALLNAQVKYTLDALQGEQLAQHIEAEARAAYHWVAKQPLESLVPKQNVLNLAETALSEFVVTDATKEYFQSLSHAILDYVAENDIEIDDVISKSTWDKIADKVIAERQIREEIISRIVGNPFYGELLSEVLYNSIKSFLQQSGPSSDKGLGGLFNVGKGLLGAALSGIEDNIDRSVKKFLSENINKTIRDSEKIIKSKLTDAKLKEASNKLWSTLDDLNFTEIAEKLKKMSVSNSGGSSASQLGVEILNDLKKSQSVKDLGQLVIDHFYEVHGHQPVSVLMTNLVVTEEKVVRESLRVATPIIQSMIKTGYLESRLKEHFQKFYESKEVTAILT
jgi:hypothetical protein